jgi:hypothetical protein
VDSSTSHERGGCVTIEIVLLALVGNIRPTNLAAVYALVSHPSPRRLMIAYIASGLLFTTTSRTRWPRCSSTTSCGSPCRSRHLPSAS